jgi:hypothetical protein
MDSGKCKSGTWQIDKVVKWRRKVAMENGVRIHRMRVHAYS